MSNVLGPVWATFTPAGRAVLAVMVLGWALAWRLDWLEMAVVASVCGVLLAACSLFLIGSTSLAVSTVVEPLRVTVGAPLTGELRARNVARTPLVSVSLDFPIGTGGVSFDLPALLPGREHTELFVVPTDRRGVIPVGPVLSARGDALGLLRREQTWTERTEVFVHPRITPLEPLGAGLIRDLEGESSQNVTMSDLSFHALREYLPGDDLRHVHWKSSARHGTLLVRQFLDTRRSHLTAIVDSDPSAYLSEDDYETAVSAAASLMVRALQDGYDVSFVSGEIATTGLSGRSALDGCSRAHGQPRDLVDAAATAARTAPDTSIVLLITGPQRDFLVLQRAASQFGVEAARVALRVDHTARTGVRRGDDLPLLTLTALDELGPVLKWGLM